MQTRSLIFALIFALVLGVDSLSNGVKSTVLNKMIDTPSTIGFIGCGTIACAIATGLLTQTEFPVSKVYVSRRSESKSSALAEKFGEKIVVCDDNQEIADYCDAIFVCVLPQQEEQVLRSLKLGDDKTLISLVVRSHMIIIIFN